MHDSKTRTSCIVSSPADPLLSPSFLSTTIARIVEDDADIAFAAALNLAAIAERRRPHLHEGVLLAAGATILGGIDVGTAAKLGAASLVSSSVAARSTIVGVHSTALGRPTETFQH